MSGWAVTCLVAAITLAVWLVIGNVLAVEAILNMRHATVIGKGALFTGLAWGDALAIAYICCGPIAAFLDD